jgi:phosphoglycolate phosphatase-like HAD superfamily hydrolase
VIRAVLFDLDYILIDHRRASGAAMAGVRERFAHSSGARSRVGRRASSR